MSDNNRGQVDTPFDFVAFQKDPPPGFKVEEANKRRLVLYRSACKRTFIIKKVRDGFELWIKSYIDGNNSGGQFAMRTDSLVRLLNLIGYKTDTVPGRTFTVKYMERKLNE